MRALMRRAQETYELRCCLVAGVVIRGETIVGSGGKEVEAEEAEQVLFIYHTSRTVDASDSATAYNPQLGAPEPGGERDASVACACQVSSLLWI
jgi:hypothetical protein